MPLKRGEPFQARSKSPEDTRDIGRSLGLTLQKGDVVCLFGDIGAGKTAFVSGMASALNIDEYLTSPTFTIMNMYDGDMPLCHVDAYRIESPAQLFETGFFEFLGGDGVVAVEWADRLAEYKPDGCVEVWISADGGETERTVRIEFNRRAD